MSLKPNSKLSFISWFYRQAMNFRNFLYDKGLRSSYKSRLKIISVGNIVAGGSGKSPFCDFLLKNIGAGNALSICTKTEKTIENLSGKLGREVRSALVLRGYKGLAKGVVRVDEKSRLSEVGDEALMHFYNFLPIINGYFDWLTKHEIKTDIATTVRIKLAVLAGIFVSKDRVACVKYLENENHTDVVILDDGFQHRKLQRDIDIVLSDITFGDEEWNRGRVLPAGYFREDRNKALKRANVLVFITKNIDTSKAQQIVSHQKELLAPFIAKENIFLVAMRPQYFRNIQSGEIVPIDYFKKNMVNALTAIACPETFFSLVQSLGCSINKEKAFPDHYNFTRDDLKDLLDEAKQTTPLLITTKDSVKVRELLLKIEREDHTVSDVSVVYDETEVPSISFNVFELITEMQFVSEDDENKFWKKLM